MVYQFKQLWEQLNNCGKIIYFERQSSEGKLEASGSFNSMLSRRVTLSHPNQIDDAVISWLKKAYEKA